MRLPIFKRNVVFPVDVPVAGGIAEDRDAIWRSLRSRGLSSALRVQLWPLFLSSPGIAAHVGLRSHELLAIARNDALAQATYAAKGGTEAWHETMARIERDAYRVPDAAVILNRDSQVDGINRLKRLLTAYALHDGQVGYCQGMADLGVPFLVLYTDDEQAFTVFCAFMARVRLNFLVGMHDMQRQMLLLADVLCKVDNPLHRHLVRVGAGNYVFAFQMLLLQLRREVPLPDLMTLWECMWAREELLTGERKDEERRQRTWTGAGSRDVPGQRREAVAAAKQASFKPPAPVDADIAPPPPLPSRPAPDDGDNDSPQSSAGGGAVDASEPARSGGAAAERDGVAQPPHTAAAAAALASTPAAPAPAEGTGSAQRVHLRVYVVAAALRGQRKALLTCQSMEEVVQFVNRFPPPSDVVALVREAERIYRKCEGRAGRPGTARRLRIFSGCLGPQPTGQGDGRGCAAERVGAHA